MKPPNQGIKTFFAPDDAVRGFFSIAQIGWKNCIKNAKNLVETEAMTETEELLTAEEIIAVQIFDLVNEECEKAGLQALVWDDDLTAAAQVRAVEISTFYSHTRPDGTEWYTVNPKIMKGENLGCVHLWLSSLPFYGIILRGISSVTVQTGLRIYCADRVKRYRR